ncbi:MAG: DUF1217 domain-containing protein [Bacteroidota bacterium]
MLSTAVAYKLIAGNLDRSLSTTAKKPQVARETEYYLAHIGDVKSIDDFLADSRLYNYAMKAYGLGDMAYAKAFIKKVLTEGIDSKDAFANKLTDMRYREFAKAFNFARDGAAATSTTQARQGTVDMYVRQTLEEDAGQQNEGARLALYFDRKASSITSAYSILGDAALLKVVQTVFNLPVQMSLADIDKQAKMITDRLNIQDLKDPEKLKSFLNRFAALYDMQNPSSSSTQSPAVMLIGGSMPVGIGSNILAALQNLKPGGH